MKMAPFFQSFYSQIFSYAQIYVEILAVRLNNMITWPQSSAILLVVTYSSRRKI